MKFLTAKWYSVRTKGLLDLDGTGSWNSSYVGNLHVQHLSEAICPDKVRFILTIELRK